MLPILFIVLVIAWPAAIGAQIVAKNIARKDPSAGFMILMLAAVPAFAPVIAGGHNVLVSVDGMWVRPAVYLAGVMFGLLVGMRQRPAAQPA